MTTRETAASVRLVQLSDCHLSEDPETSYRGVSADAGLRDLVPQVARWAPEAILLSGDLSEDASENSYSRLSAMLDPLNKPLLALPGNHDRPADMREDFPIGPWDGPYVARLGNWRIVLLDSVAEGRVEGVIVPRDIAWLSDWLGKNGASPVLLALHHQPVPVDSPWIDRYMLCEPEPLLKLIEVNPVVRCVVWGHVHQAFEARRGAARLLACPSTAVNSLPGRERFTVDPAGPAGRWLELDPDGTLRTGLLGWNC